MPAFVKKVVPWLLVAGAVFGWYQTQIARARAEGRLELLIEQRDSILAAHDSTQAVLASQIAALGDTVSAARVSQVALRQAGDSLEAELEEVLTRVEPEVRTIVRATVDTLRAECDACDRALQAEIARGSLLRKSLDAEQYQHRLTRKLLTAVQQRSNSRISVGVTLGVATIFDGERVRTGPGVAAGVQLRVF